MNPPDFKKFVTGFLVLATIASSGAFVFSDFRTASSSPNTEVAAAPVVAQKTSLVEPLPTTVIEKGATQPALALPDPKNLTEVVAYAAAQKLVEANPTGPQQVGPEGFVIVPSEDRFAEVLGPERLAKLDADFDALRSLPTFSIIENSSAEENSAYLDAVDAIMGSTIAKPSFVEDRVLNRKNDPEIIPQTQALLDEAERKLSKLRVPSVLAQYHSYLLAAVKNQLTIQTLLANPESDPMKALYALERSQDILARDYARIHFEAGRLVFTESTSPTSATPHRSFSLINVFGVPTAHAQLDRGVLTDLVRNAAQAAIREAITTLIQRMLETAAARSITEATTENTEGVVYVPVTQPRAKNTNESLFRAQEFGSSVNSLMTDTEMKVRKVITETLKRTFVQVLVREVINWVQTGGQGGATQYPQSWQDFMRETVNDAGGAFISAAAPQLCSSFGPLISLNISRSIANNTGLYGYTDPLRCTLEDVLDNMQDFVEDFQSGGWIALNTMILPQNNIFGAIIQADDALMEYQARAADAREKETVAAGGFLSPRVCIEYVQGPTMPGQEPECARYQVTTPGGFIADAAQKANSSVFDHLVNIQDFADLIDALLNSFLVRLMQSGQGGVRSSYGGYTAPRPTSVTADYTNPSDGTTGSGSGVGNTGGTGADVIPPSTPGRPMQAGSSPSSVILSWTASVDNIRVTEYDIFRSTTPGGTRTLIDSSATNSYEDADVTPGLLYFYTVQARDAAGNTSALSAEGSGRATLTSGGITPTP